MAAREESKMPDPQSCDRCYSTAVIFEFRPDGSVAKFCRSCWNHAKGHDDGGE